MNATIDRIREWLRNADWSWVLFCIGMGGCGVFLIYMNLKVWNLL